MASRDDPATVTAHDLRNALQPSTSQARQPVGLLSQESNQEAGDESTRSWDWSALTDGERTELEELRTHRQACDGWTAELQSRLHAAQEAEREARDGLRALAAAGPLRQRRVRTQLRDRGLL